jgi:hypothetical protein
VNETRIFEHEFHKIVIREFIPIYAHLLEAGAAVIKHLGGRPSLQQIPDLRAAEWLPEKIAIDYFHFLLREKLSRLTAGGSAFLAIEINFHSHDIPSLGNMLFPIVGF